MFLQTRTSQMSLRRLLNERCLSDVSSTSYASHVYLSDASQTSPQWEMLLRCLFNELCLSCEPLRCFSDVSSMRDASQMSPQRAMPLMCFLNEIYVSQMPLICLLNERCLSCAFSKNFRIMKCLILGMRATCISHIHIPMYIHLYTYIYS